EALPARRPHPEDARGGHRPELPRGDGRPRSPHGRSGRADAQAGQRLTGTPAGIGVVRVALVGLGPIGLEIGRALAARPGVRVLGAADPAPSLAGTDVGTHLRGGPNGHPVVATAAALYAQS